MPPLDESQELIETLQRFQLQVPQAAIGPLDRFRQALWDVNLHINLTRHDTFESFVGRDVMDALKLAELLSPRERVLDVGSGGGVPGVLVAILRPDLEVICSEAVGKKAGALREILDRTGISLEVQAVRAERLLKDRQFETVTARAVGPMQRLLSWFQPYWHQIGRMLLIKGPGWVEERGTARHLGLLRDLDLRRVSDYDSPHNRARNVILQIQPKSRR